MPYVFFLDRELTSKMNSIIELNVAVICGCLAVVRPFLRRHFPGLLGESRVESKPCYNKSSGSKANYFLRGNPRNRNHSNGSIAQLSYPPKALPSWDGTGYSQDIVAKKAKHHMTAGQTGVSAGDDLEMGPMKAAANTTVPATDNNNTVPEDKIMRTREVDVQRW